MRTRSTVTVAALAAVLIAGTGGAVAATPSPTAAAAADCGWQLVPTPAVPGSNTLASAPLPGATIVAPAYGTLNGVDAIKRGDVRVSGDEVWPSQAGWLLNAKGGSVVAATPQLPGVPLSGTPAAGQPSFDSADDGWVLSGQAGTAPDAEHWHDGRWSLVQLATLTGGQAWPQFYTGMNALVALSPTNAWAAGGIFQGLALVGTVIEHWDGTTWQLVPHPLSAASGTLFTGLTALAPDDLWLIGEQRNDAGVLVPLTEHWDGGRWTLVKTPAGNGSSALLGISGSGPDDVWAVGDQTAVGSASLAASLTEHFDGTRWRIVTVPDLGNSKLTDVYAAGPKDAWAMGTFAFGVNQVFLHWDGKSWSPVSVPGVKKYNTVDTYNAIDGSGPGDVWAVGQADDYGNQTTLPVAAHLSCQS